MEAARPLGWCLLEAGLRNLNRLDLLTPVPSDSDQTRAVVWRNIPMRKSLEPCPFCGEPAELDRSRGFRAMNGKLGDAVAIYCTACNADMTLCKDDVRPMTDDEMVELLTEQWNKRSLHYEQLTREISSRSISQLPGLLQCVVRMCSIQPVFKDKEAMLRFVDRAWKMGGVGNAEMRQEASQGEC
jgi:restriction alleviation protein Lar